MSRLAADFELSPRSFPRVSGDEPFAGGSAWTGLAFSPRERG